MLETFLYGARFGFTLHEDTFHRDSGSVPKLPVGVGVVVQICSIANLSADAVAWS